MRSLQVWQASISRNLNHLSLTAPENAWIFQQEKVVRSAIGEWANKQPASRLRSICLQTLSLNEIIPATLLRYVVEFFDPNVRDLDRGTHHVKTFIPFAHVSKEWNQVAVKIQANVFNATKVFRINRTVSAADLVPFFRRIQPKTLLERGSTPVMTRAILAAAKDTEIRVTHMNGRALATNLIDPALPTFSQIESITNSIVPARSVLSFLQKLWTTNGGVSRNSSLKEFAFKMSNSQTNLLEIASFLPRSLVSFPLPNRASATEADSYGALAIARCQNLTTFNADFDPSPEYGKKTLYALSELTTLQRVAFTLHENSNITASDLFIRIKGIIDKNKKLKMLRIGRFCFFLSLFRSTLVSQERILTNALFSKKSKNTILSRRSFFGGRSG